MKALQLFQYIDFHETRIQTSRWCYLYETEGDPTGLSQQAATRPKDFMRSVKQMLKRKGIYKLMVGMTTGIQKYMQSNQLTVTTLLFFSIYRQIKVWLLQSITETKAIMSTICHWVETNVLFTGR